MSVRRIYFRADRMVRVLSATRGSVSSSSSAGRFGTRKTRDEAICTCLSFVANFRCACSLPTGGMGAVAMRPGGVPNTRTMPATMTGGSGVCLCTASIFAMIEWTASSLRNPWLDNYTLLAGLQALASYFLSRCTRQASITISHPVD